MKIYNCKRKGTEGITYTPLEKSISFHQQQWKRKAGNGDNYTYFPRDKQFGTFKNLFAIIDINFSLKFRTFLLSDNDSTLPKVARDWRNKTYAKP